MKHELWVEPDGLDTFLHAGPRGDAARAMLPIGSKLVLTIEAASYFEAMTKYYQFRGLAPYTTSFPEHDMKTYKELGWE